METHGNQLSRYGAIANPIAVSLNAKVFFVAGSGVSGYADLQNEFPVDKDGVTRVFTTIDAAIGACVANRGDVIFVMPGHVETVTTSAGIALDVAGVSIIGLGTGSLRPQINFTTAVTASLAITAANTKIENILFTGGIDALTKPLHIQAADVTLLDIETRDVTGQATDFIVTTAAADRLKIFGWIHRGATAAGADTAISIVGGDGIDINNFDIDGNFAVSAIENVTTACTNLKIGAKSHVTNIAYNRNSSDVIVTLVAGTTGFVDNILARLTDNAANITEALVGAGVVFGNNLYIVNLAGERAMQWNGTVSTDA